MLPPTTVARSNSTGSPLGCENKLWLAADKLRNNMVAEEHKRIVLGLIFLGYTSDSFEEHRARLNTGEGDFASLRKTRTTANDVPAATVLSGWRAPRGTDSESFL